MSFKTATSNIKPLLKAARRIVAYSLLCLLVLLGAFSAYLFVPVMSDPTPGFAQRKGELARVIVTKEWRQNGVVFSEITLVSSSGLDLELTLRRPGGTGRRKPAMILLGGHRTGRDAASLAANAEAVVIAALSYPYRGKHHLRGFEIIPAIPDIQQAIVDTAPATMLALDFLLQQPDVDPLRVELVGVSLGAFLGATPGALDERFKRVWLVQGAGEPADVFEHKLRDGIRFAPARHLIANTIAALIYSHYLKPELWVGKISPRPVIVINTRGDEAFPDSSVSVLHQALGKQSEVIWAKGRHIRPTRTDVVEQLSNIVLQRISQGELGENPENQ